MKFVTIPLSEITDSREVMEQRLPKLALIFIYAITISLILLIIWSCVFEIETVNGEGIVISKRVIFLILEKLGIM